MNIARRTGSQRSALRRTRTSLRSKRRYIPIQGSDSFMVIEEDMRTSDLVDEILDSIEEHIEESIDRVNTHNNHLVTQIDGILIRVIGGTFPWFRKKDRTRLFIANQEMKLSREQRATVNYLVKLACSEDLVHSHQKICLECEQLVGTQVTH